MILPAYENRISGCSYSLIQSFDIIFAYFLLALFTLIKYSQTIFFINIGNFNLRILISCQQIQSYIFKSKQLMVATRARQVLF